MLNRIVLTTAIFRANTWKMTSKLMLQIIDGRTLLWSYALLLDDRIKKEEEDLYSPSASFICALHLHRLSCFKKLYFEEESKRSLSFWKTVNINV